MSATTTLDLDAVEQDATRRLVELGHVRQRLSLDALESETAAEELADVESQMTSARDELERVALARSEVGRRESEAAEQAKRDERARLITQADKIAARLPSAARTVDNAASDLARAIAAHRKLAATDLALRVQAGTLTEPGGWQPKPPYEGALRHALADEGCGDVMDFHDAARTLRGGVGPMTGR